MLDNLDLSGPNFLLQKIVGYFFSKTVQKFIHPF